MKPLESGCLMVWLVNWSFKNGKSIDINSPLEVENPPFTASLPEHIARSTRREPCLGRRDDLLEVGVLPVPAKRRPG